MADEISRTIKLNWSKGGASLTLDVAYKTNQTSNLAREITQVIGAASEAIEFGDVTDPAVIGFKNLEPTWSSLTPAEKVTEVSQAVYDPKHTVHVGTTTPCTEANATHHFAPGAGTAFDTDQPLWYAIKKAGAEDVTLLVLAIQR
jgi:hypothetical protein